MGDFQRDPSSGAPRFLPHPKEWLGHAVLAAPFEAHTVIDYTSPLGGTSGIYFALTFQLRKWEFQVFKADEWIEVSPVFTQYYQLTQKQKEELEGRIKGGLASASQAVADLELLQHDQRKYREFLNYFGYRTVSELAKEDAKYAKEIRKKNPTVRDDEIMLVDDNVVKRRDEHYLKSIFIDQVDKHTGEGISMLSIVQRWPTLIVDFQRMTDKDVEVNDVAKKLDISRAEATVLVTKNKLYIEWKKLFEPQLRQRYTRLDQLVKSREKSVDEYREWLKPVIARHKLITEGLASEGTRRMMRTLFVAPAGQATSFANVELWTWRDLIMPEFYKVPGEQLAKARGVEVDDKWTRENFIFHKKYGLITEHPWVTPAWVEKKKEEIYADGLMKKGMWYYTFFVIQVRRSNIRMATGFEIEDGQFDVNAVLMSQNALFAKLLELKAKEEEFENYVNTLLGVEADKTKLTSSIAERKGRWQKLYDALEKVDMGMRFWKTKGPYERDFDDRVTKYYAATMAGVRYAPIVDFIKKKAGVGVS